MMDGFEALASSSVPSVMTGGGATAAGGGGRTPSSFMMMSNTSSSTGGHNDMSWKRSLSELAATNQSNIDKTMNTASTFGAGFPVGSTPATGAGAAAVGSTPSGNDYSIGGGGGGIDNAVMHRRMEILQKLVNRQEQNLQRRLDDAVNSKLSNDWTMEREWWRKELIGERHSILGGGISTERFQSLSHGDTTSSSSTNRLLTTNGSSSQSFQGAKSTTIVEQHLDIARKFILQGEIDIDSDRSAPHRLVKTIEVFQNLAASIAAADGSNSNSSGYLTAWKILSSIIPRIRNTKQQSANRATVDSKAMSAACGAMNHYCHQYYTLITSKVNEASLAGLDVATTSHYTNSMASTVASYTKLVIGSQSSDIWTKLYYCIRCGDFNAANSILESDSMSSSNGSFPEHPVLSKVILDLQKQQGGMSCLFQMDGPIVDSNDRELLYDHLRQTKNLEPNSMFKLKVLAILCGQPMESPETIEDHMYGSLWVALLDMDPVNKLVELGSSIRQLGPHYFDGGGWGYCLPLLASQQFKTALLYLQSVGPTELLQAVHIGLVFDVADVQVDDLTAEVLAASSSGTAAVMLTDGSSSTNGRIIQQPKDVVSTMLVEYVHLMERDVSVDDKSVVPYLLLIGNSNTRRIEMASLIGRTNPVLFNELAGTPDENGNGQRQDCFLDIYLSDDEVSIILDMAAAMCRKQAEDPSMALRSAGLYLLAGRYASLVSLLNQLISPPDDFSEFKVGWAGQSRDFCRHYLDKRTAVLDSLDQGGKNDLIFALRSLLELRMFHENTREGNYETALELMRKIRLLPNSEMEVDEKAAEYRTLDRTLQMAFPSAIVGTVKCLYEMFCRFKSEPDSSSQNGQARLKQYQLQVRILFVFCGLIEMPSDMKRNISQMKAGMVFV